MLDELDTASRVKLLGSAMLSLGLLAVASALVYFSYTLSLVNQSVPAILAQAEITLDKVDPVLAQVEATRRNIAAVHQQIPPVLEEVKAVRQQIPPVLKEVAALRQALPPMIDTTAKSIHEASVTVDKLEPHIPQVLEEVRETREAMPELMTRAETLVANAGKAGREASSGAVVGFFGGIISAPFRIIGGIGKGFANAIGLTAESGFTEQDIKLAEDATNKAIRKAAIGNAVEWENTDSNNRGTVTLLEQHVVGEQACFLIRYQAYAASGETHDSETEVCQDAEGNWVQPD